MTKFKKLMALAAVSMLGIQIMGLGTAFAVSADGSECDFSSDSLEVTLGLGDKKKGDAEIYVDDDGLLNCDAEDGSDAVPASTIDSITVEMDDDDSAGNLTIYLDDSNGDAAEWPDFETFDINVTTKVYLDGSGVDDSAGNSLRVTVGAKSLSFLGTTATTNAPSYEITGGDLKDTIDGSKSSARFTVYGGLGNDSIKGGSGKDNLDGEGDDDSLYGNGGNDLLDCGGDVVEFGWGGDGDDYIDGCRTAAPGAGDDVIDGASRAYYGDLTAGMEWTNDGTDIVTGGAAGEDDWSGSTLGRLYGGAGADTILDDTLGLIFAGGGNDVVKTGYDDGTDGAGATVYGGAGNDLIVAFDFAELGFGAAATAPQSFYGDTGDDILRGKGANDVLRGGPGNDQAWGGGGMEDICFAEVTNRCELGAVA